MEPTQLQTNILSKGAEHTRVCALCQAGPGQAGAARDAWASQTQVVRLQVQVAV